MGTCGVILKNYVAFQTCTVVLCWHWFFILMIPMCVQRGGGEVVSAFVTPSTSKSAHTIIPRRTLSLLSQVQQQQLPSSRRQGGAQALYDSTPQDDMFYDGYDEFIRNLQEDLDNNPFDIYSSDGTIDETFNQNHDRASSGDSGSGSRGGPKKQRNKRRNTKKVVSYRRDPNDDMSESAAVDEKEINRLIQLRTKAQQVRNYDLADKLLYDLNNDLGVYVWDRDRLWSVSPIAPSRRYNGKTQRGGGDSNGMDMNMNRGREKNNNHHNSRQFGRYGHDYVQIGNGIDESVCPLKLHEIHSLIAKRLEFKLVRNYSQADEIQSQLYDNGVRIHDKLKQWRADGGIFADMEGMLSGKPFEKNEHSEPIDDVKELDEIEKLVVARDEARSSSNYNEADRLREILWKSHRVAVDDKSRTYSKGGDFGIDGTFFWTDDGPINPRKGGRNPKISRDWRVVGGMYAQSAHSQQLNDDDEEEVHNLIHDRLEAKRVKDFEVADLILDHLYREYQISVDDQLRQWSVGGEFDDAATQAKQKSSPTAPDGKMNSSYIRSYNRRGGTGELSEKEIQLVEAMVARRSEEMSRFNRQAASSIRKGLRNKYYIVIDDVNCEWHVRGNDFILSPKLEGNLPKNVEESREEIEKLIRERSQARGERDFSRADDIRSDLLETYDVTVDDRVKEWGVLSVVRDESSNSPAGVMDHVESQSSLSKLTVIELKSKLKAAGLPVSGKKAELIQRILQK